LDSQPNINKWERSSIVRLPTQKRKVLSFSVYGNLVDRYLFNFRADPDILASHLPQVKWLKPRIINGSGIVSFCLLKLEGLTVWPLPSFLGFNSTSSAYRCAVVDSSGASHEPSVYVLGRNTDLPIISRLGPVLFSGKMQMIHTSIEDTPSSIDINANYMDGQNLFSAKVKHSKIKKLSSKLFDSVDSFVSFIKGGASSYAPSTRDSHYSRVDLEEDSNYYVPVGATINHSWLDTEWADAGLVFDSAFHAGGGRYKLKYLGSVPAQQKKSLLSFPNIKKSNQVELKSK
jgi:hypothetical protein